MAVRLSGLWRHVNEEDGSVVFTGNLGNLRLRVVANAYKTKDSDPDAILYLNEPVQREMENAALDVKTPDPVEVEDK